MAIQVVTVDTATGACGRSTLRGYPQVVSDDGTINISTTTGPNGETIYNIGTDESVVSDVNDGHIIATHTSGSGATTNIEETVTSLASSGTELVYTDENGNETAIPVCDLLTSLGDSGVIGG